MVFKCRLRLGYYSVILHTDIIYRAMLERLFLLHFIYKDVRLSEMEKTSYRREIRLTNLH